MATPTLTSTIPFCVVGAGAVGKSSLIVQYQNSIFEENSYDPTIQDTHRKKEELYDGETYMLEIVDTAGEDEFKELLESSIQSSEGFMIVYSVSARRSFQEVTKFIDLIRKNKGRSSCPIFLVGNKIDEKDERVISEEEGVALARKIGAQYFETSAKTAENVRETFLRMANQVKDYMMRTGMIKQKKEGCIIA